MPLVMLASALAALAGVLGAAINIPVMTDAISWFAGGSAWLGLRLMILAGSAVGVVGAQQSPQATPVPGASGPSAQARPTRECCRRRLTKINSPIISRPR